MAPTDDPAPAAAPASWKTTLITMLQNSFVDLTTKEYEKEEAEQSRRKIEANKRMRLRGYVAICMLGLATMHWGGAQAVLNHIDNPSDDKGDKNLANTCVRFLTVAFNCSLLGLMAGTFPATAPWALFFAGLGAWQSILFILALFHLETRQYHLKPDSAMYSFCISAALFSIYWSHAAQDPLPLHSFGKFLQYIVHGIFYISSWIWSSSSGLFWLLLSYFRSPRNQLPRSCRRRES